MEENQTAAAEIVRRGELATSNSVAGTTWTDEKHNSYLNNLEMSFLKQLNQSKALFVQSSKKKDHIDVNISQKQLMSVHNATEQFTVLRNGCWEKIKYERNEPVYRTSADSSNPLKSPSAYSFKLMGSHCPQPSPNMPGFVKLSDREKQENIVISHGLTTFKRKQSSNNPHQGDLFDLGGEGTGQNFSDDDNQNRSNIKSRAKRPRKTLGDSSSLDQIVPSNKCPTTDSPVIAHHESQFDNLESFGSR